MVPGHDDLAQTILIVIDVRVAAVLGASLANDGHCTALTVLAFREILKFPGLPRGGNGFAPTQGSKPQVREL